MVDGSTLIHMFPLLESFDLITKMLTLSLTITGFLVAAATFVTGLYLSRMKTFPPKGRLKPFIYLIISLIAMPIIIVVTNSVAIAFSALPFCLKLYLLFINLAPIVPVAVISYLIARRQLD